MKKIIIAGGSGFLGQVLENYFSNKNYSVKILSRSPKKENEVYWNAKDLGDWKQELEHCDVLINLTGKSVDCRYNEKNKALILNSRISSTSILGKAINECKHPPKIWMNASTATVYEYSEKTVMSEDNTNFNKNDFSTDVGLAWEKAFYDVKNSSTRKIAVRTSIILGKGNGAFVPLKMLTKFGMGGKQGSGSQKVSWMHELDYARAIDFIIANENIEGPVNFCSPKPISNASFMSTFRKVMKIPFGIPHPTFILKIGAFIIGTETELILKSRNVIPKRLLEAGFEFKFPTIHGAISDLIK